MEQPLEQPVFSPYLSLRLFNLRNMFKVLKSSKAAIRFSLKYSKKYLLENKYQESLIVLCFSFGGVDKRFSNSTVYTVSYTDWDYQKQRIKTNKSRVITSHIVNSYLNKT